MNINRNVVQHQKIVEATTDDLLTAIISLKDDVRFNQIYEWLETSKKKVGDACLWEVKEPEKTILQGRLQMLTVILETIDEALDKMQTFRVNQQKSNERIVR